MSDTEFFSKLPPKIALIQKLKSRKFEFKTVTAIFFGQTLNANFAPENKKTTKFIVSIFFPMKSSYNFWYKTCHADKHWLG